jgi:beta-phosphoglucomutase-like phosphatase (HAD superfamily)
MPTLPALLLPEGAFRLARAGHTPERVPRRARPIDQPHILAAALARARASAPRGVAVFDLDSTLIDNRPRQALILQDYGRTAGLPALLATRPEHVQGWDLDAALRNAGLPESLVSAHADRARQFWEERFFTSAFCRFDVPVAGAPAFVRAVRAAGARIAYVTGRPEPMEEGTLEVLGRFDFPLPDGETTWLFMKPGEALRDDAWKAIARDAVDALGPIALVFENEPAHVNAYARAWRRAFVVHLDTDHSGRPVEVDRGILSVADLRLERAEALLTGAEADATAGAP